MAHLVSQSKGRQSFKSPLTIVEDYRIFWHKPNISRGNAIWILLNEPEGTFLVRDSNEDGRKGTYLFYSERQHKKVRTVEILFDECKGFHLKGCLCHFHNVQSLLAHHCVHARCQCCSLLKLTLRPLSNKHINIPNNNKKVSNNNTTHHIIERRHSEHPNVNNNNNNTNILEHNSKDNQKLYDLTTNPSHKADKCETTSLQLKRKSSFDHLSRDLNNNQVTNPSHTLVGSRAEERLKTSFLNYCISSGTDRDYDNVVPVGRRRETAQVDVCNDYDYICNTVDSSCDRVDASGELFPVSHSTLNHFSLDQPCHSPLHNSCHSKSLPSGGSNLLRGVFKHSASEGSPIYSQPCLHHNDEQTMRQYKARLASMRSYSFYRGHKPLQLTISTDYNVPFDVSPCQKFSLSRSQHFFPTEEQEIDASMEKSSIFSQASASTASTTSTTATSTVSTTTETMLSSNTTINTSAHSSSLSFETPSHHPLRGTPSNQNIKTNSNHQIPPPSAEAKEAVRQASKDIIISTSTFEHTSQDGSAAGVVREVGRGVTTESERGLIVEDAVGRNEENDSTNSLSTTIQSTIGTPHSSDNNLYSSINIPPPAVSERFCKVDNFLKERHTANVLYDPPKAFAGRVRLAGESDVERMRLLGESGVEGRVDVATREFSSKKIGGLSGKAELCVVVETASSPPCVPPRLRPPPLMPRVLSLIPPSSFQQHLYKNQPYNTQPQKHNINYYNYTIKHHGGGSSGGGGSGGGQQRSFKCHKNNYLDFKLSKDFPVATATHVAHHENNKNSHIKNNYNSIINNNDNNTKINEIHSKDFFKDLHNATTNHVDCKERNNNNTLLSDHASKAKSGLVDWALHTTLTSHLLKSLLESEGMEGRLVGEFVRATRDSLHQDPCLMTVHMRQFMDGMANLMRNKRLCSEQSDASSDAILEEVLTRFIIQPLHNRLHRLFLLHRRPHVSLLTAASCKRLMQRLHLSCMEAVMEGLVEGGVVRGWLQEGVVCKLKRLVQCCALFERELAVRKLVEKQKLSLGVIVCLGLLLMRAGEVECVEAEMMGLLANRTLCSSPECVYSLHHLAAGVHLLYEVLAMEAAAGAGGDSSSGGCAGSSGVGGKKTAADDTPKGKKGSWCSNGGFDDSCSGLGDLLEKLVSSGTCVNVCYRGAAAGEVVEGDEAADRDGQRGEEVSRILPFRHKTTARDLCCMLVHSMQLPPNHCYSIRHSLHHRETLDDSTNVEFLLQARHPRKRMSTPAPPASKTSFLTSIKHKLARKLSTSTLAPLQPLSQPNLFVHEQQAHTSYFVVSRN